MRMSQPKNENSTETFLACCISLHERYGQGGAENNELCSRQRGR